jgi:hypothetical protein
MVGRHASIWSLERGDSHVADMGAYAPPTSLPLSAGTVLL